ncbi:ECF-type sigma factor [Sulfidibacter corallicola]|nr:ECF-type sigma factor [Sulfidibacter corallicola]
MLQRWTSGDQQALDQLAPMIYQELHRMASAYLISERRDHTLQPTALVHELYMTLMETQNVSFANRNLFFAFAGHLMRRILIQHARGKASQKAGGNHTRVLLNSLNDLPQVQPRSADDLLDLDKALNRLGKIDTVKERIMELHLFAGLGVREIAGGLNIPERTISRKMKAARIWLLRSLNLDGTA